MTFLAAIRPAPARAQQPESHAKLELIAEDATSNGSVTWMGVLFRLDPGWHVYWRNPGDSGEPPKVKWDLPVGFRAGEVQWPTPIRLGSGSVIDYGYEGQVLLMATIERAADAKAGTQAIGADVRYVVCREICIPGKAQLRLSKEANEARTQLLFAQTRKALPQKMPATWRAFVVQNADHVVLIIRMGGALTSAAFFPLDAGVIENSAPQEFAQVVGGFSLSMKKSEQLLKPIDRLRGLISMGPGRSFEVDLAVANLKRSETGNSE